MLTAGPSWGLAGPAIGVMDLTYRPPRLPVAQVASEQGIGIVPVKSQFIFHYTTYSFAEAVSSADAADGRVSDENESGYLNSVRSML